MRFFRRLLRNHRLLIIFTAVNFVNMGVVLRLFPVLALVILN